MTITISSDIQKLIGVGIEYLIDCNGEPIAEFYNGSLVKAEDKPCLEGDTIV